MKKSENKRSEKQEEKNKNEDLTDTSMHESWSIKITTSFSVLRYPIALGQPTS